MVMIVVDLDTAAALLEAPEAVRCDDNIFADEMLEVPDAPRKRGRPKKVQTEDQLTKVLQLYFVEKLSMRKVADIVGMSHMSVYRMLSDPNVELLL